MNAEGRVQISDFGMSRVLDEHGVAVGESTMDGGIRCARYDAPELVVCVSNNDKRPPTKQSDVWAFGATLLVSKSCHLREICHGLSPFTLRRHSSPGKSHMAMKHFSTSLTRAKSRHFQPTSPMQRSSLIETLSLPYVICAG